MVEFSAPQPDRLPCCETTGNGTSHIQSNADAILETQVTLIIFCPLMWTSLPGSSWQMNRFRTSVLRRTIAQSSPKPRNEEK
jgi:hypothetical protein